MASSHQFGVSNGAENCTQDNVVDGLVDYKGRPASRSDSGGWRAAAFTIGAEVAERFAFHGIGCNLITYLSGPLGQSTATAAANVNAWSGTASLLPLLGASVADSLFGRYRTIALASVLYVLGLGLLTLSAILPSLKSSDCRTNEIMSCSPTQSQLGLFFFALYLVAIGEGGHKPCIQAFGADQFDGQDPEECKSKSSFFNWWYFGVSTGALVTISTMSYIQDNLSWALGFGIPCSMMIISVVIFLLGTTTYRYNVTRSHRNPFVRIGSVFVAAFRNRRASPSAIATEVESGVSLPHQSFEQFKFLNKALIAVPQNNDGQICSVGDVEEAKILLRLVPIWATCLVFSIGFAQPSTLFIKQGATLERTIFSGFKISPASLLSIISLSNLIFIPIYDRIFVPIARALTRKPSGITMLQRIGTGIFLSILTMIIAALVEIKRLQVSKEYNLVDNPSSMSPMTIWWLVPQCLLIGMANIFTIVGLQEFFYDQIPKELRSIGLALYHSVIGVGSFLSSFLVLVIDKATSGDDRDSWFSSNLNRAHLDYFYWLLAGLSALGFVAYLHFARYYIYNTSHSK